MPKRPRVEPTRQLGLFQNERAASQPIGRVAWPYSLPGIRLGTSAFTATGWEGSFYPVGMKPRNFLSYYATQFDTVEIDSTFYGTPTATTVANWNEKTPPDFIFTVKVPQVITHDKILIDCEPEFDEFIETMSLLGNKLGPVVFQFPKFDKRASRVQVNFLTACGCS